MSFTINDYSNIDLSATEQDILARIARVKHGFRSNKTLSLQYRKQQLRNLFFALQDNWELIKEAMYKDFHRNPKETEFLETGAVESEINGCINNLDKWSKDDRIWWPGIKFASTAPRVKKGPFGTVLIISPWNYPLMLSLCAIASAIAAGNTVVWKPTEVIPNTTKALTKVIERALDPDLLQVINGGVEETTIVLNQQFDKIMYTGGGRVGQVVATAAAKHLTPTILELGGKSPVFLTKNANIKLAAKRIAWGKFTNAGQTCVAPDYILVDATVEEEFVNELKTVLSEIYPNISKVFEDYAHIPTDKLYQRLVGLIKSTNGQIVVGGDCDEESRFIAPTVVTGVTINDPLMQDEIFGPILPIITLKDVVHEGIQFVIDNHDTPLALYVFSSNQKEADYILEHTRSGGALINDLLLHVGVIEAPFGGIGSSGYGNYHGKYGFDAFTHSRTVLNQPTWAEALLKLRYPPFTSSKMTQFRAINTVRPWFSRTGPVKKSFLYYLLAPKTAIVTLIGLLIFMFLL